MAADPTQLEFINETEQQYFAEAVMGIEVREFLNTSVGRFLHGCAKAKYDESRDKLCELDPYTPEGKREWSKLQADAWAASHFMQWCVEAIQRGEESEALLNRMRDGE